MGAGKRLRKPRGIVVECPKCQRNGVALRYSWRRGRYDVGVLHIGLKDDSGFMPLSKESCSFKGVSMKDIPKALRDLQD